MRFKHKLIISLVFGLIGLMVAIQFQTNREPDERDTRDLWEVRSQLQEEQKFQQNLYQQIRDAEQTIDQYEANSESEKVQTLKNSLENLRSEAGLTDLKEPGIIIDISPIFVEKEGGQPYPAIAPDLLNRLINELNTYGATDIQVANERIVDVTPVRSVNGETYVNNHPLPSVPLEIKVLAANPEKLKDYMEVSHSKDDFAIENLDMEIRYEEQVHLTGYQEPFQIESMRVLEETGDE
ncbi:DUF881 domain-containing protein [Sediminibacillus halophilus]|uniref:Uncharacterized conserved protein YlxW, UPF0749 family n=1 Tax=Sediminibacillus halophilus TaxID=482461 RepID=A0A1G9MR09_9BACI|nr:DUF881 domain-containing protein [Sediminibacillus halophilus]SDL76690.1 Uncharacterized conserved protein YlxW, UPF0749 family [Sediminibacillus halophilus]